MTMMDDFDILTFGGHVDFNKFSKILSRNKTDFISGTSAESRSNSRKVGCQCGPPRLSNTVMKHGGESIRRSLDSRFHDDQHDIWSRDPTR